VEHIASRVAVMYLGRVVEMAATAALFARPVHPYTRALLQSVLTPEPGLGIPETGLGLAFPDPLNPPPGCPFHPRCPDAIRICPLLMPPLAPTAAGIAACHVHAPAEWVLRTKRS
jgi:peptide/nickel transport system ATP-binding protein